MRRLFAPRPGANSPEIAAPSDTARTGAVTFSDAPSRTRQGAVR